MAPVLFVAQLREITSHGKISRVYRVANSCPACLLAVGPCHPKETLLVTRDAAPTATRRRSLVSHPRQLYQQTRRDDGGRLEA